MFVFQWCINSTIDAFQIDVSFRSISRKSIRLMSVLGLDVHCRFPIKFAHQKSNQCACNGQFRFQIDHLCQLMEQFEQKPNL